MDKLKLVAPTLEYKDKAIEYIEEFNVYFSPINGVGGLNRYLNDYTGWLKKLEEDSKKRSTEEKIPALTYFLVREKDDRIVGMINIRLKLNEKLKKYAGHIGYSIRPTERQKGYNKINLYLGLKVLYEHGEKYAFLDCDSDNLGSAKTIEALGGELIREYYNEDDGCMIRDYNIDIKKSLEEYGGLYEQEEKKNKTKGYIISLIVTLIIGVLAYYFLLPPINLQAFEFYVFIFGLLGVFTITSICLTANTKVTKNGIEIDENSISKFYKYEIIVVGVIVISIAIADIILSPIFNANSYSKRITIDETGEFTKDIKAVNFEQLPLLDKASSQKLGDRVMGQMPELVSQFYVSELYTQINYNDKIVRVTPLEYADIIKYFSNRKDGVAGYITVDSVTGSSKLTKLEKGMKYMPSALFNENLQRHIRFKYPTEILGDYQFEIDNEGNPYWIVTTIKYTGINLKKEISGVIIVDPITGHMKKYKTEDVPTWVDHVYSADLIIEQVDDWGSYRGGFLNSIFGQKNVVQTTEGYNYTVMNDDVYLYTGITSAVSDESNLGFILTNLRTKETKFYAVPGAEEYSAMSSAEGQVQQMKYTSTFPLLVNLNNKPTYLISLKDDAGLVKMYAFVDVEDYQKVVVTDASKGIEEAAKNYLGSEIDTDEEEIEKEITIKEINIANIDGTTYYYLVDTNNNKYKISIKVNKDKLPFIKKGDKLTIYYKNITDVTNITNIK